MSFSPSSTPPATREYVRETVEEALSSTRKEIAHGNSVLLHNIGVVQQSIEPGGVTYKFYKGTRKKNNMAVKKSSFGVLLGIGAEELPEFEMRWVQFLRSDLACKKVTEMYASGIMKTINTYGRDLDMVDTETRWVLVEFALLIAVQLGKVKLVHVDGDGDGDDTDDDSDESDDTSDNDDDAAKTSPEAKKAAMKQAAKRALEQRLKKKAQRADHCWSTEMGDEDRASYVNACLLINSPIERQMREMVRKARVNVLYPGIKRNLRAAAPELVPFHPHDVPGDKKAYTKSKLVCPGFERGQKWPRMCPLLCGVDEHGEFQFYYTPERGEPHAFVNFIDKLACDNGIENDEITPSFIAFGAMIAGQVASVGPRKRGHHDTLNKDVQGDMKDRSTWNAGIKKALNFIMDKQNCKTREPLLTSIQKKKKGSASKA